MVLNTYLSIITLNINSLNGPNRRHRVAEWIRNQDPYICGLQETHLKSKDSHRLMVKGWKKDISRKWKGKTSGVAVIISSKIFIF